MLLFPRLHYLSANILCGSPFYSLIDVSTRIYLIWPFSLFYFSLALTVLKSYADHLAGVKVLNGIDKVIEGGAVVFTLKDQNILTDGDINEGETSLNCVMNI